MCFIHYGVSHKRSQDVNKFYVNNDFHQTSQLIVKYSVMAVVFIKMCLNVMWKKPAKYIRRNKTSDYRIPKVTSFYCKVKAHFDSYCCISRVLEEVFRDDLLEAKQKTAF